MFKLFNFNIYFSSFVSFVPSLSKRPLDFQTAQMGHNKGSIQKRVTNSF